MTLDEALDIVIARTKHERFRWLCSDDNPDAEQRAGYRRHVLALAEQGSPTPVTPPPLVPVGIAIEAIRTGFRACLYSSHEGCGCTGTRCFWKGRIVSLTDCIECLKGQS